MTKRTFRHGIHPHNDGKALTADAAIREFRPAGEAVYPLGQHIGAPAQPVVAVGDPVLVGQTLAQPNGFVSAAICSAAHAAVPPEPPVRVLSRLLPVIVSLPDVPPIFSMLRSVSVSPS